VERVWFGADGKLLARTRSGRVFETADFEIWTASPNVAEPPPMLEPQVANKPEPGARVVAGNFGRMYALGRNLFRSDDSGLTWANLTAYKTDSVIGFGQHSVALGGNPDQIVVANDFGVWRSMDGGLSWSGLNQLLPNLRVKRILATPQGVNGTRVQVDALGAVELQPGTGIWQRVQDPAVASEDVLLKFYSGMVGSEVRSYQQAGSYLYLGTADGRIWVSDSGGAPQPTDTRATGPVERIFADPSRPRVALAAIGGGNAPHVLRTINGGGFWDSLDSNLPSAPAHGIAGDLATGTIYVAMDRGIFWAPADLDSAGNTALNWNNLSTNLPPGTPANDVRLDAAGVQLYAAMDGYGVYTARAPLGARLRLVNAADLSTRAAAPGGLVSVIGGRVNSATGGSLNYPVLAAGDDASQIQVPFDATGPNVTLSLATSGGRVQLGMQVRPVSPAIFVGPDGSPMLQDADSGLLLDARNAAKSGARVQVFATGLGRVNPDWNAGVAAPLDNPPQVAVSIRAFLNGAQIPVTKATLAPGYIGFYQVEVQLPTINNAGVNELYLVAGAAESNRVPIVIEP
jgi:uncharacterized protein (TIGR03437 family)